jgi:hypothetical protein
MDQKPAHQKQTGCFGTNQNGAASPFRNRSSVFSPQTERISMGGHEICRDLKVDGWEGCVCEYGGSGDFQA